jgi:predicted Zn-dependent protease
VKPRKIMIKSVQRPGTLADFFQSNGVPQKQMAEMALLNNMELSANVQTGKLIKIIGE